MIISLGFLEYRGLPALLSFSDGGFEPLKSLRSEFRRYPRCLIHGQSAVLKPPQKFFGSFLLLKKELVFGSLPKERTEIEFILKSKIYFILFC
jgi:hypothetical protein